MYVFHDHRFEALEQTAGELADTIERLVEATSFASEPEYMANVIDLFTLCRWLDECPDIAGLRRTRCALSEALTGLANSLALPHRTSLKVALAQGDPVAPVVELLRGETLRHRGAVLLTAVDAGDRSGACSSASELAASWLGALIHPQTIFNKLVGKVLAPEQEQSPSSTKERLIEVIHDLEARVPQSHVASVVVELAVGKHWHPPLGISGVQIVRDPLKAGRFEFRVEVDAADPRTAASSARARFLETVDAWHSSAPDLRIELPTAVNVTMPDGSTVAVQLRAFRVATPRVTVTQSWGGAPFADQRRFVDAAEAMTGARREVDEGRVAQAISTLWSATEAVLRRDTESTVSAADVETRMAGPFLRYFAARQVALLGLFLDMSKATRPRLRAPVDPRSLWADLISGEIQRRVLGRRIFLRDRINELVLQLTDPTTLQRHLAHIRQRVHDALFAARIVRNSFIHSRLRIATDFEERYVYRWIETLLDVSLHAALGQSRRPGFTMDGYLADIPGRLGSFHRRVAYGPPYDWLLGPKHTPNHATQLAPD